MIKNKAKAALFSFVLIMAGCGAATLEPQWTFESLSDTHNAFDYFQVDSDEVITLTRRDGEGRLVYNKLSADGEVLETLNYQSSGYIPTSHAVDDGYVVVESGSPDVGLNVKKLDENLDVVWVNTDLLDDNAPADSKHAFPYLLMDNAKERMLMVYYYATTEGKTYVISELDSYGNTVNKMTFDIGIASFTPVFYFLDSGLLISYKAVYFEPSQLFAYDTNFNLVGQAELDGFVEVAGDQVIGVEKSASSGQELVVFNNLLEEQTRSRVHSGNWRSGYDDIVINDSAIYLIGKEWTSEERQVTLLVKSVNFEGEQLWEFTKQFNHKFMVGMTFQKIMLNLKGAISTNDNHLVVSFQLDSAYANEQLNTSIYSSSEDANKHYVFSSQGKLVKKVDYPIHSYTRDCRDGDCIETEVPGVEDIRGVQPIGESDFVALTRLDGGATEFQSHLSRY